MYVELESNAAATATEDNDNSSTFDCNWVAERAVASAELSIGGQRIDKHYQRWWRLYSELYLDEAKKANWAKMTTAVDGNTVYLPLIFFFNRNPGLYLPLIALQYHEVRIDFDLTDKFASYCNTNVFKVWANYVYLDTEERRRFAQKGHEYLIEQVQHTGSDTVSAGASRQVRLSYNHPVKELVWCFNGGSVSASNVWNFSTGVATSGAVTLSTNPFGYEGVVPTAAGTGAPMLVTGPTNGGTAVWQEDGAVDATHSVGPLDSFKLILNGQDRMKEHSGKYFNQVQPFNHHSGCPYPGVYSYSFALRPEEHQPSGTCNFSRIDNAQVAVTLKSGTEDNTVMHMFATNYNVLRIQSGMGGLAFSN
jgi:hypothetical protein